MRQVGRKSLIQAVARAYRAGRARRITSRSSRAPQDIGKSSAIRALATDEAWFADEVADLGSKDAAQDLRGKWLIELAELAAMRAAEVERTKAFITPPSRPLPAELRPTLAGPPAPVRLLRHHER